MMSEKILNALWGSGNYMYEDCIAFWKDELSGRARRPGRPWRGGFLAGTRFPGVRVAQARCWQNKSWGIWCSSWHKQVREERNVVVGVAGEGCLVDAFWFMQGGLEAWREEVTKQAKGLFRYLQKNIPGKAAPKGKCPEANMDSACLRSSKEARVAGADEARRASGE